LLFAVRCLGEGKFYTADWMAAEGGRGRLLSLRFTLRAAYGWLSPFGRFAER
jgi:hypothetical protein